MKERFAKETDQECRARRLFLKQATLMLGAGLAAPAMANARGEVVDISHIPVDGVGTLTFQGQPIVIVHRGKESLASLEQDQGQLADPSSLHSQQPKFADNPWRSRVPEWLVMVNICTHAGCSTRFETQMEQGGGGFFCPCHGSRYDAAGRVLKDQPAPWNMEIPNYEIDVERKQVHLISTQPVKRLY